MVEMVEAIECHSLLSALLMAGWFILLLSMYGAKVLSQAVNR